MAVKKIIKIWAGMLLFCSLVFTGCGEDVGKPDSDTTSERVSPANVADAGGETAQTETQTDNKESETDLKEDEDNMRLTIDGTEYEVELDNNVTVDDIVKKLPLELTLTRYAGHEYYSELPFTPSFAKETTSNIKAGHVYYWDGWNAFVINYEDYDISPYQVVHIGEVKSDAISEMLKSADDTISVSVR